MQRMAERRLVRVAIWAMAACLGGAVCRPEVAIARVFDFGSEWIAGSFRASGAISSIGQTSFLPSVSGSGVTVDKKVGYDYSGELGVVVHLTSRAVLALGFEFIRPSAIAAAIGSGAGGAKYFDLNSAVLVTQPVATFEAGLWGDPHSRAALFFGMGYAGLKIDNEFTVTAAGQTALGTASFADEVTGRATSMHYGVLFETLFVDNVTAVFQLGYRDLRFVGLDFSTGAGAGTVRGDLNMSAYYLGLLFRFYVR